MAGRRRGSSLDDRLRALALEFADEVARTVRRGLSDEVAARVAEVLRNATREMPLAFAVGGGPRDRRLGKRPVPVKCPVAGCTRPGIRAKRNFCVDHDAQLTDAEKKKLRDGQLGGEKKKLTAAKRRAR